MYHHLLYYRFILSTSDLENQRNIESKIHQVSTLGPVTPPTQYYVHFIDNSWLL